jgi:putative restriction endonuclease
MNAYVAVTDRDWFDFLAAQEDIDEVNFWQPNPWGGRFGVLRRGEPLLFKLKAPVNAVVGGGYFEHYTELPMSLAWDAFGIKNGAASRQAVWDRIARLRRGHHPWYEDFTIGCIILVEPFFWPRELWIPQPPDFGRNIVRGKTYDLTSGHGLRLWEQVLARLPSGHVEWEPHTLRLPGGYVEGQARRRLGQGAFRILVTDAYRRQCAVTQERALPALEAAHIRSFHEAPVHDVRNGLLLRSDIHRLFDAGYVTVTPELRLEASPRMRDDFNDGENYVRLHGSRILVPDRPELWPDPESLRWHNENRFRG